jgi:hypothetical protein
MKTLISTLLVMASIAGPAAAMEVRVSLEGKSPATIREDVSHAASEVCTSAFRQGMVNSHEMIACERTLTDDALQQARLLTKPA